MTEESAFSLLPKKVTLAIPFTIEQVYNMFAIGFAAATAGDEGFLPNYAQETVDSLVKAIDDTIGKEVILDAYNEEYGDNDATDDYTLMYMFFTLYQTPKFKYSTHKGTLKIIVSLTV